MTQMFTAKQVAGLFTGIGKMIEEDARSGNYNSDTSTALEAVAQIMQHSFDWDWELENIDADPIINEEYVIGSGEKGVVW